MKTAASTLIAFVGLAAAQSLGDIPGCATQCGQDMLSNQGTREIDCEANDIGCLCQSPDFILGIRDCTESSCDGPEQVAAAVSAGVELCNNAGVQITTPGASATDGTASGSNTASASATSNGGNGGGAGGLVSTITSDGSTIVTTLSSSSGGIGASISEGLGSLSSGIGSVTSAIGSATSSLGSAASSATETATETATVTSTEGGDSTSTEGGNGGGDATGSDGAAATSEDGEDAAPMMTAAPAGIIAAAGIAAFML